MPEIASARYTFLGGGIIAGVLVERLVRGAAVPAGNVLATDVVPERRERLRSEYGIRTSADNGEGAAFGDVIFLAVPPNAVTAVLAEVRDRVRPQAIIISLAAAVPTARIEEVLGHPIPVVRVIPNTPSLIGRGMNPHCLGRHFGAEHVRFLQRLLALFGQTIRVEERLMNAATALTAVGPTYLLAVIKALGDAGIRLGLPEAETRYAAAETVAGTALLVLETGKDPEELKEMIGLRTLNEPEARRLFASAVEAAFEKLSASEKKLAARP